LNPEETVPVSIFSQRLSPSEALCKYLKEERKLNFHEISGTINRDERSVWTSCRRAARKMPKRLVAKEDDITIPLAEFTDRSKSILEHVVVYLKAKHKLSNKEIAKTLNKQQGAIATVANRAAEKGR
jgi:DNA-directed RNA polymerase specialized sigma24 family protein